MFHLILEKKTKKVNKLGEIISFYDLYRMAAGEQTAYYNYSNSLGDSNLDTLPTGRGRLDIHNGALPNTSEDEDAKVNEQFIKPEQAYKEYKLGRRADTQNVVDGKRHLSTATPALAAKVVNEMYGYAGESVSKYFAEENLDDLTNDEAIAQAGHRSTYSDYYKDKEAKENDKPFSEWTKDDLYRSECQICGSPLEEHPITEGNDPHEWLAEQPEDYKGDMSLANEGGQGSGKIGHQTWMRAAEFGMSYKKCPNCQVYSGYEDGKCSICGEIYAD